MVLRAVLQYGMVLLCVVLRSGVRRRTIGGSYLSLGPALRTPPQRQSLVAESGRLVGAESGRLVPGLVPNKTAVESNASSVGEKALMRRIRERTRCPASTLSQTCWPGPGFVGA
eukprot:3935612-Rhodomonas_salina.1